MSGIITQILQICTDYNGLPDIRTMTLNEIRFFYEPLIDSLVKAQIESKKMERKNGK